MPWPVGDQVGDLEHAGGQDDRRRQQEREPGRVLPGQAAEHARDHGDAVAADASQQGEDLRGADDQGLEVVQLGQPPVGMRTARRARPLASSWHPA